MQNIPVAIVSPVSNHQNKDPKKNTKLKNFLIVLGIFFVLFIVSSVIDYLLNKEKYSVHITEISNIYEDFALRSGEEENKVNEIFLEYAKKTNELLINDSDTNVDKKQLIALVWLHKKLSSLESPNLEKDVVVMMSVYDFMLNDNDNKYYTVIKKLADDTFSAANIHYEKRQQENIKFASKMNDFCATGILSTLYCMVDSVQQDGAAMAKIDDELYASVKEVYIKIHSRLEQSLKEQPILFKKPSSVFI